MKVVGLILFVLGAICVGLTAPWICGLVLAYIGADIIHEANKRNRL